MKSWILAVTLAAICVCGAMRAVAADIDYPARPVKLIVPYPPGGGTDIVARVVANRLGENLKQSFLVENRGGAGGILGTEDNGIHLRKGVIHLRKQ